MNAGDAGGIGDEQIERLGRLEAEVRGLRSALRAVRAAADVASCNDAAGGVFVIPYSIEEFAGDVIEDGLALDALLGAWLARFAELEADVAALAPGRDVAESTWEESGADLVFEIAHRMQGRLSDSTACQPHPPGIRDARVAAALERWRRG